MLLSLSLLKGSEQLQLSFWVARRIGATQPGPQPSQGCSRSSRHCMLLFPVQTSTAIPSHPSPARLQSCAGDSPQGQPVGWEHCPLALLKTVALNAHIAG